MIATTADRYERAAQSLGLVRGALLSDDADSAIAGAFSAFGLLWGTESRVIWEEASRIAQELGKGYKVPELHARVGQLRDLLVDEAKQLREEKPAEEPPLVLIMVESDPDYPDDLMGDPILVCPHDGCLAEDDVKQVDVATRWNSVSVEDHQLKIGDGNSDDGDDQGYICGACQKPVSFSDEMDSTRVWW
jgi:hypothetical protein